MKQFGCSIVKGLADDRIISEMWGGGKKEYFDGFRQLAAKAKFTLKKGSFGKMEKYEI